ncbi:MAG: hypothetical protein ACOH1N_00615 [Lutibacter sp.]
MKVDINNIRRISLGDYTDLCMILNESINTNGRIILEAKDIKVQIDSLRLCLALLAATSIEGREDFKAIGGKELPILILPNEETSILL